MMEAAPADETGRTPTAISAEDDEVAGRTPGPTSVQVAYLHGTRVSHSWHQSMMTMMAYDKSVGLNVIGAMPYAIQCSGPGSISEGRNLAAKQFLDNSDAEWLFFVDTDMGFRPEAMEQLLLAADPVERPVVGGLCFAMKYTGQDGKGGFHCIPIPTLFMWANHPTQGRGFASRFLYPPETMVQVAGTGAAFILIHRSVLEQIRAEFGDSWFNLIQYADGTSVSEDLSFCYRVGKLQRPVFVHTGVRVTHHKEIWLDESGYMMPEHEPMNTWTEKDELQEKVEAEVGEWGKSQRARRLKREETLNHEGSDRWTGGDKKLAE